MTDFFNEEQDAGTNLTKWNRTDTYTFTSISGITGPVVCHGPAPGQYTLTLTGLPTHAKLRYSLYWHFVDSLDNEESYLMIDGVIYAEFRKSGFTDAPVYTINRCTTSTWTPATYSYAPWGTSNDTKDGYVVFNTGWFDHTASTVIIDHVLGHDQAQTDEAMYLSHVHLEFLSEVGTIPTNGLYLHLDAALANSFPGKQKFVFRARRVGTTESVIFTHYHKANSLPVSSSTEGFFTPPPSRPRVTTTSTTTSTSTTTEPPTPVTINISQNLGSPILAHQVPVITFTLNLPVIDFDLANVTAVGVGTLSSFAYTPGTTTATALFTPTLDALGSFSILISLRKVKGTNGAWNQNSNVLTLNVNAVRPEMVITTSDPLLIAGETALVTFTSSNSTTTFDSAGVTFQGPGTLTGFTAVSGTVYTATVTPRASWVGEIEVNVAINEYTNTIGNFNRPSNVLKIPIDTRIPSMVITVDDSFLTYSQTATLTFTSNLATSDFILNDITVNGKGTLGTLSGSDEVYTSVYTPQADEITISASNYNQPSYTSFLKLNGTSVATVGRGHMAAVFDTSEGNIKFVSSTTKDTYGTPSDITDLISYLNAIPTGNLLVMTSFDATTVDTALRTTLNSDFGGVRSDTWSSIRYSHVFIGYKNVTGRTAYEDIMYNGEDGDLLASVYGVAGSFMANVQAAVYTSANGNPNTSSNDLSLAYDTERPNMVIYSVDQYLTYGETSVVYFIASQPTTDFVAGDIVITGDGALSGFTAVSSMIYTAVVTPTTNTVGNVFLSVPGSSFTNSVGNPNLPSRLVRVPVMTVTTTTSTTSTTTAGPTSTTTTTTASGGGGGGGTSTSTTTASGGGGGGGGTSTSTTTASGGGGGSTSTSTSTTTIACPSITYPATSTHGTYFTWSISGAQPNEGWYVDVTGDFTNRVPGTGTIAVDASGAATYTDGDWSNVGPGYATNLGTVTLTFHFDSGCVVTVPHTISAAGTPTSTSTTTTTTSTTAAPTTTTTVAPPPGGGIINFTLNASCASGLGVYEVDNLSPYPPGNYEISYMPRTTPYDPSESSDDRGPYQALDYLQRTNLANGTYYVTVRYASDTAIFTSKSVAISCSTTTTAAPNPVSLADINGNKSTHLVVLGGSPVAACNIYLYFAPNGDIYTQTGEGDINDLGSWYIPETGGAGSGYYIRWTVNSVIANTGAGNYYDVSSGWLSLGSTKSFGVSAGSTSAARQIEVSYTVEIATDSGGSNIVATGTHSLEALVSL